MLRRAWHEGARERVRLGTNMSAAASRGRWRRRRYSMWQAPPALLLQMRTRHSRPSSPPTRLQRRSRLSVVSPSRASTTSWSPAWAISADSKATSVSGIASEVRCGLSCFSAIRFGVAFGLAGCRATTARPGRVTIVAIGTGANTAFGLGDAAAVGCGASSTMAAAAVSATAAGSGGGGAACVNGGSVSCTITGDGPLYSHHASSAPISIPALTTSAAPRPADGVESAMCRAGSAALCSSLANMPLPFFDGSKVVLQSLM